MYNEGNDQITYISPEKITDDNILINETYISTNVKRGFVTSISSYEIISSENIENNNLEIIIYTTGFVLIIIFVTILIKRKKS